jgi:hypothetical protein
VPSILLGPKRFRIVDLEPCLLQLAILDRDLRNGCLDRRFRRVDAGRRLIPRPSRFIDGRSFAASIVHR